MRCVATAASGSLPTRRSATRFAANTRRFAPTASRRSGSTTCPAISPATSKAASSIPHDASVQPARLVRRLASFAADAGVEIREHDRVDDVTALDADQVVVATDGYGHGLVPELADSIWPTRGQVIVSEPLDRVLYDRPHYARQGFDYWQQLPDRRVLLGGFRDVSILDELTDVEEMTPAIQDSLEAFLGELIGETPRISHRWAGIFGLTQDMLPLVGRVPGRDGALGRRRLLRPRQRPRLRVRRARRRRDTRRRVVAAAAAVRSRTVQLRGSRRNIGQRVETRTSRPRGFRRRSRGLRRPGSWPP